MALRQIRIGSLENVHQYDDGDFDKSMEVEDPIKCTAPAIDPSDLVRLGEVGVLYPISVADVDDPTELALVAGSNGMIVLAYKVVGPAGLNEYTLYAYDSDGPAVNKPYVVDALGVGNERWIAIGGKYRIFTNMYTLATKNPPIDADKVLYRDSTALDVLVTSTWTQVKAFLKTYFDTLYGALGTSHTRLHSIVDTLDHSSAATPGQILKANANGLPVDATNTDVQVAATVAAAHSNALDHVQGTDTALGVLGTKNPPIDADLVVYRDSTTAFALVTSTWTQIKAFLKTYFDTLYEVLGAAAAHSALTTGVHGVGAGTVAEVADIAVDANLSVAAQAAISAAHARSHAISSTSDHSDVNLAGISNDDLMQWDDPSSKWIPQSIAEIISGNSLAPGPITISDVEDWRYAASIADDGTKALPTIKANYAAIGNIVISSAGVVDESAEFEIDSTGTCQIIRGSANVVVNADTDTKLCLGTSAAQNPLTIKNRLGGVKNIMITIMYVKA